MTSLANQLKRLAVGHTRSILGDDRKRRSLLFDPKEAANLDRETYFSLGINGLHEMILMDERFEHFENSLFSHSSQSFERSVQSKEANKLLDDNIQKFLLMLSPYLLLKPAQKCIEWLIYRYHIHYYNEDVIMMAALPYHGSNVFIRLLQILDLDKPTSAWHWLHLLQKSGNHLTKSAIIKNCHKNIGFFVWICTLVGKHIEAHGPRDDDCVTLKTCLTFYSAIVCGVMASFPMTEEYLASLKPFLAIGLKSPLKDYKSATYLIIAQLCTKVQMNEDTVTQLVTLVAKKYSRHLIDECLMCILIIYQTQQVGKFPKKACTYLLRMPGVRDRLPDLVKQFQSKVFSETILELLFPLIIEEISSSVETGETIEDESRPCHVELVNDLICFGVFDRRHLESLIRSFIPSCLNILDGSLNDATVINKLRPVLCSLENRFSGLLSRLVNEMKNNIKDKTLNKKLTMFMNKSLSSIRYQRISPNTDVLIALYHNESFMRVDAVQQLFENIDQLLETDQQPVEEGILDRLKDDHDVVLEKLLSKPQILWKSVLAKRKLIQTLKSIIANCDKSRIKVLTLAIEVLCEAPTYRDEVASYIMPYLCGCHGYDVSKSVLNSTLASSHGFLKSSKDHWLTLVESNINLSNRVALDIAANFSDLKSCDCLNQIRSMYQVCTEETTEKTVYHELLADVIIGILGSAQTRDPGVDHELMIIIIQIMDFFISSVTKLQEVYKWAEMLIEHIRIDDAFQDNGETLTGSSSVLVFDWLLRRCSCVETIDFQTLIKRFLMKNMKDFKEFFSFLSIFISGHLPHASYSVSSVVQGQALKILEANVTDSETLTDDSSLRDFSGYVAVILLISLNHPLPQLRETSLSIAQYLRNKMPSCFSDLLNAITGSSSEISADRQYIKMILQKVLKENKNKQSPRRKLKTTALHEIINVATFPATPGHVVLAITKLFENFNSEEALTYFSPLIKKVISSNRVDQLESEIIKTLLRHFTSSIASSLCPESDSLSNFILIMKLPSGVTDIEYELPICAITQISKEFYAKLPDDESRRQILVAIFDVLFRSDHFEVCSKIQQCLKHIVLKAAHLQPFLNSYCQKQTVATVREAKRVKRNSVNNEPMLEFQSCDTDQLILLLEVIQNKKKILNVEKLISPLYSILIKILEFDGSESTEYVKLLVLTTLHNVITKLSKRTPDVLLEENLHMEMVVECVRSNNNPQSVHQALLLLSVLAYVDSTNLLHHVITVFTFMGTSVLRQDDEFSLHVIRQILNSLIPAVIMASGTPVGAKDSHSATPISAVVHVFVASYPHMPSHRRLSLFAQLVSVLGADDRLSLVILMLLEHFNNRTTDASESHDVQFCLDLCSEFTINCQILSAVQILRFLIQLPKLIDDKPPVKKTTKNPDIADIFDIDLHTEKQLRQFRYSSLSFLINLFASDRFIENIPYEDINGEHWTLLLEALLQYGCHVSNISLPPELYSAVKYWRVINHKIQDLLEKIMAALSPGDFYEIILSLTKNKIMSIRRKSVEILSSRLLHTPPEIAISNKKHMLAITDRLHKMLKTSCSGNEPMTEEELSTAQHALYALKLICHLIGPTDSERFIEIVKLCSVIIEERSDQFQVAACALLFIAQCSSSAKVHIICHMPVFMTTIATKYLSLHTIQNELLLTSVVTCLHKLVDNLVHFLSPYLNDIIKFICEVCNLKENDGHIAIGRKTQVTNRVSCIIDTLASQVPARVLLSAIESSYQNFCDSYPANIKPVIGILSKHVHHMSSEDVRNHQNQLLSFFLFALDCRTNLKERRSNSLDTDLIDSIESDIIDTIIVHVLRLTEETFRPLLFKLFHWATEDEGKKDRVLIFYILADRLAGKLKSLFTPFAGHIVKYTATLLDHKNPSKIIEHTEPGDWQYIDNLIGYNIDCLSKYFLYNSDPVLDKEKFDCLMQPLVDQIENDVGGDAVYQTRIREKLVPCLGNFVVSLKNEPNWRALNYQILLKSRSSDAKVRYSSLLVLEEVHKRLGDDSLGLLTDTVPFIAELMEDDNEEVEDRCQTFLSELEKIHGESVQKYF